jgi:hypothetical protein
MPPSPDLKTETDPVSETLCFTVILNSGRWTKSTNSDSEYLKCQKVCWIANIGLLVDALSGSILLRVRKYVEALFKYMYRIDCKLTTQLRN